jgi:hypothetical protein
VRRLSGHMLLNSLAGFTYNIMTGGVVLFFFGLLPFSFIVAFSGLELAISVIQAQVFVVLSSSYIKDAPRPSLNSERVKKEQEAQIGRTSLNSGLICNSCRPKRICSLGNLNCQTRNFNNFCNKLDKKVKTKFDNLPNRGVDLSPYSATQASGADEKNRGIINLLLGCLYIVTTITLVIIFHLYFVSLFLILIYINYKFYKKIKLIQMQQTKKSFDYTTPGYKNIKE